jgi:hypothetical protein
VGGARAVCTCGKCPQGCVYPAPTLCLGHGSALNGGPNVNLHPVLVANLSYILSSLLHSSVFCYILWCEDIWLRGVSPTTILPAPSPRADGAARRSKDIALHPTPRLRASPSLGVDGMFRQAGTTLACPSPRLPASPFME